MNSSGLAKGHPFDMKVSQLFNVFSRRNQPPSKLGGPLTSEFRTRVLQVCRGQFPLHQDWTRSDQFWPDVYNRLRLLHGRNMLAGKRTDSTVEDILAFLHQCKDDHFLDFVELIFQSEQLWERRLGSFQAEELVGMVNKFLELDGLPYSLTGFVFPLAPQGEEYGRLVLSAGGPPCVEAYPQIIRRENDVIHSYAIDPTLTLLTQPHFKIANKEFLGALEDYRKGQYGDCVTKCGSAFESVMKVVCNRRRWQYEQTDAASSLMAKILPNTKLPSFFKEPLTLIATARNRLSSSHGGGTQQRIVPKHVASFVVNSTAAAILLIVDETK